MEIFRRFGFDKLLFFATLLMIASGLVMVFSSSAYWAIEEHGNSLYFFIHQLMGVGLGIGLMAFILTSKYTFYQNAVFVYGMVILTLAMLAGCFVIPAGGNTFRWIRLMGFSFQPSELAKISLILFLAYYLNSKKDRLHSFVTLIPPLIILVMYVILIILEPDFSTSLLVFSLGILMLFLGGIPLKYFFGLGVVAVPAFAFLLMRVPYQFNRLMAFLSPSSELKHLSYQPEQAKLAIGSGGVLGVSIGKSLQKLLFLPDAHTDFIYSIIGEEFGLLGTLFVLLLFGIFLWRGLVISRRAPNLNSQLLAAGLTIAICAQALLNITVVLGLVPATGLPLPLFSYGRSSMICTLFSIAILLHISQRKTSQRRK